MDEENEENEDFEQTDEDYKKVELTDEMREKLKDLCYVSSQKKIKKEMIQNYLLEKRNENIIERIKEKGKQGLILKIIISAISIALLAVFMELSFKFDTLVLLVIIGTWIILFRTIGKKTLKEKILISISAIDNVIEKEGMIIKQLITYDANWKRNIIVNGYEILDYLSSPEGKEWIKTKYENNT